MVIEIFMFEREFPRDKKEIIQPNLIANLLLIKGYKYKFFSKFV